MSQETELSFYAPIGDESGFEQATRTEIHSQYTIQKENSSFRARSTTVNGDTLYTLCIKKYDESGFGATELEHQCDKNFYEAWVKFFNPKGVNKIRYVFITRSVVLTVHGKEYELPELKYEVDVYLDHHGRRSKWCKIDIELDKLNDALKENGIDLDRVNYKVALSSLPLAIDIDKAFNGNYANEEERKAILNFWERFSYHAGERKELKEDSHVDMDE